jgi:hypothetical protein
VLGPLAGLGISAACFALGSVVVAWALPRGVGERGTEVRGDREGYWRRFAGRAAAGSWSP